MIGVLNSAVRVGLSVRGGSSEILSSPGTCVRELTLGVVGILGGVHVPVGHDRRPALYVSCADVHAQALGLRSSSDLLSDITEGRTRGVSVNARVEAHRERR